ncbi:hypothetical protein [Janthinobacterium sp. RB2R34]
MFNITVLASLLPAGAASAATPELVVNGSFEGNAITWPSPRHEQP